MSATPKCQMEVLNEKKSYVNGWRGQSKNNDAEAKWRKENTTEQHDHTVSLQPQETISKL